MARAVMRSMGVNDFDAIYVACQTGQYVARPALIDRRGFRPQLRNLRSEELEGL